MLQIQRIFLTPQMTEQRCF